VASYCLLANELNDLGTMLTVSALAGYDHSVMIGHGRLVSWLLGGNEFSLDIIIK
jgi:hypothetical protein